MSFIRVGAIVLRQLYLIRTSFSRVLPLFIWVAVDILLWGFLTRYLNTVAAAGFNFVPAMLGAVLLWDFFIRIMQGVTMSFFEDVWSRNFLNVFSTPISLREYLAGMVLTSIVTSSIGIAVMFLLAVWIFGFSFLSYGIVIIPFLLVLFMFGIALGIAASALVLRLGPAAEWFIWPIPAIISPFVGVLYPISVLPQWMQAVSRALPPSYVFESLRAVVFGGRVSWAHLFLSLGLTLLYIFLSCLFFKLTYRHALNSGLIARYSAENLG
ncbi:MAG: ABC transporter permease [Candidatus Omnitrophica bacterium]|nr:ABC transporter permease [Candidatus Omnitrophota bacterium]MBU1925680.1 ABC transporter permease [Candidatus Omnitrophota bacterium]MBU2063661.1 ABC transporter permease [Candidatus Omnitrophota bacterium]